LAQPFRRPDFAVKNSLEDEQKASILQRKSERQWKEQASPAQNPAAPT
jgi:hypothetical protein